MEQKTTEQHLLLGDSKDVLKTIIGKRYEVFETGVVVNKRTNKVLKFHKDNKGYMKARIYCPELSKNKDGRIPFRLHRLVALFHLPNFDKSLQINHINGIKDDNNSYNLEMVTASQNCLHAWRELYSAERKNKLNQRRQNNGKFGK